MTVSRIPVWWGVAATDWALLNRPIIGGKVPVALSCPKLFMAGSIAMELGGLASAASLPIAVDERGTWHCRFRWRHDSAGSARILRVTPNLIHRRSSMAAWGVIALMPDAFGPATVSAFGAAVKERPRLASVLWLLRSNRL